MSLFNNENETTLQHIEQNILDIQRDILEIVEEVKKQGITLKKSSMSLNKNITLVDEIKESVIKLEAVVDVLKNKNNINVTSVGEISNADLTINQDTVNEQE